MALYRLTTVGSYFNQQVINRWTYDSSGVGASVSGSFALAFAFGLIETGTPSAIPDDAPFGYMMNILSNQYSVETALIENLYDPVDFYERPFPGGFPGSNPGAAMSPTAALGFRTNRVRTDVDRGTKRLVGATEDFIGVGGVISGTFLTTNMVTLAGLWSDTLEYDDEGSTFTFVPCVLSLLAYTTPRGNRAYHKYPTLEEQLDHAAIGVTWQPIDTIRTQVSRQYGRGA